MHLSSDSRRKFIDHSQIRNVIINEGIISNKVCPHHLHEHRVVRSRGILNYVDALQRGMCTVEKQALRDSPRAKISLS